MNRLAFAFACLLVTLLIVGHQRCAPVELALPAPPPAIPAAPPRWMDPVVVKTETVILPVPLAPISIPPWSLSK